MSDGFSPGFASRIDASDDVIASIFSALPEFSASDLGERARVKAGRAPTAQPPKGFAAREASGPKHFSPADRDANPTEGWDPLAADLAGGNDRFVDPATEAHERGFAEGLASGLVQNGAEVARDKLLIESMIAGLSGGTYLDRDRLARQLRQTVLALVTRIVGETGVSGDLLTARIDAATDLLAEANESALLHLNPADLPLVEGRLPKTVFAAGDAKVARGSFVIESASTIVEDGPELWLEQLAAAIDRVPLPKSE